MEKKRENFSSGFEGNMMVVIFNGEEGWVEFDIEPKNEVKNERKSDGVEGDKQMS